MFKSKIAVQKVLDEAQFKFFGTAGDNEQIMLDIWVNCQQEEY